MRLRAAHLLFRIAFAYSLASWLQLIIRQPAPCRCTDTITNERVAQLDHTGMPSSDSAATVIVAAMIVQAVSIPIGLFLPLLYGTAQVVTGFYSIGQVTAGVGLGIGKTHKKTKCNIKILV
jgi:hypothetical protein